MAVRTNIDEIVNDINDCVFCGIDDTIDVDSETQMLG